MSYRDDEEFKEDDIDNEEEAALGNLDVLEEDLLVDDDIAVSDDLEEDEPIEGFAGIDGAEF
jgi:hypothetical protein